MKKSTIMILLIANGFAYMCIWVAPLMHGYFYDAAMEAIEMTHTQFGVLGSIAGFVNLIGYIFGGMVADKFNTKKLLLTAYAIQTGVLISYSFFISYTVTIIIVLIGATCGATLYWGAMAKYVRTLGNPKQEGRLYGLHWALVGIGGTIIGFTAATLIGTFGATQGLRYTLYLCAAITTTTFFTVLFLYHPKAVSLSEEEKFKFTDVKTVLKMPVFWMVGFAALCLYCTSVMISYAAPMLKSNFSVPLVLVSLIGTFRSYFSRAIFAPIGGYVIDKTKSSLKFMRILMITALISTITLILIPWNSNYFIFAVIIVVILSITYSSSSPTWFTPVSEIGIPEHIRGTAVGLLSGMIFSADSFMYLLGGHLIDTFGNRMGYIYLYGLLAVFFIIGVVMATIAYKKIKK